MNKLFKRMSSLALVVAMLFCMMSTSALAAGSTDVEEGTEFELAYVIYDVNGDIREEGIIPNGNARYTWSGITLANGEHMRFYQSDGRPFTIVNGTIVGLSLTMNRSAHMALSLVQCTSSGEKHSIYASFDINKDISTHRVQVNSSVGQYYYPDLCNLSSDPVTVITFKMSF